MHGRLTSMTMALLLCSAISAHAAPPMESVTCNKIDLGVSCYEAQNVTTTERAKAMGYRPTCSGVNLSAWVRSDGSAVNYSSYEASTPCPCQNDKQDPAGAVATLNGLISMTCSLPVVAQ